MEFKLQRQLFLDQKKNLGFAIPQILILGIGVSVAVSGIIAASILGLTGSKINRQEQLSKASSESGVATLRNLLNDSGESFFHYFWLGDSCSPSASECPTNVASSSIPNPPKEY